MGTELTIRDTTDIDTMTLGKLLAKSGYFKDALDASKAVVKVLAGRELGFGPIASMSGIYIVSGKPTLSANLMAAAVKRHPAYNYRVKTLTDKECTLAFFEMGKDGMEQVGESSFTATDAQKAGTGNMGKFPRNMLFARAMSNGVKWFAPDAMNCPIYSPDEMGATVDFDTGEIIDVTPEVVLDPVTAKEPEHDLVWAQSQKTGQGTVFAELSGEQLAWIIENPDSTTVDQREAAGIIIDAMQAVEESVEPETDKDPDSLEGHQAIFDDITGNA